MILIAFLALTLSCERKSKYADVPPAPVPDFNVFRTEKTTQLSQDIPPGGVAILFFGYRGCPDICSSALRRIGQAHEILSPEHQAMTRTVFIEVGQTPLAEAGAYARSFDPSMGVAADPDGRITQALQIFVHPVGNSQPMRIEHSGTIILADHKMISRKRLPHDISAKDLAYEIEVILRANDG